LSGRSKSVESTSIVATMGSEDTRMASLAFLLGTILQGERGPRLCVSVCVCERDRERERERCACTLTKRRMHVRARAHTHTALALRVSLHIPKYIYGRCSKKKIHRHIPHAAGSCRQTEHMGDVLYLHLQGYAVLIS